MYKTLTVSTTDPFLNLGREELLLRDVGKGEVILYLWQNAHTIVIGKNQNPWRECAVSLFESEKGTLARRSSGGGAVYHDLGNLNFTFIADRAVYDVKRQLSVVLSAVRSFGLDAEFSGRNDLTLGGRKFSGNAFKVEKDRALHHGTLLIDSDLAKVSRYLTVSKEKMQSKGVESVAARVCTLSDCADVTVKGMSSALYDAFEKEYGRHCAMDEPYADELESVRKKYAAWDWRFGESPKFDIQLEHRFDWGGVEINLGLAGGRIKSAKVYSDAMDEAFIGALGESLIDVPFHSAKLCEAVKGLNVERDTAAFRDALASWLMEKNI